MKCEPKRGRFRVVSFYRSLTALKLCFCCLDCAAECDYFLFCLLLLVIESIGSITITTMTFWAMLKKEFYETDQKSTIDENVVSEELNGSHKTLLITCSTKIWYWYHFTVQRLKLFLCASWRERFWPNKFMFYFKLYDGDVSSGAMAFVNCLYRLKRWEC